MTAEQIDFRNEVIGAMEKHQDLLFNLYGRWQDEKQYEDWNDYIACMRKNIPNYVASTKRPFGVIVKVKDAHKVHVFLAKSIDKQYLVCRARLLV